MKKYLAAQRGVRFVLAIALGLTMGSLSYAQMSGGPKGAPMYNKSTEITVKGTVEAVTQMTGARAWSGTHLQLKTATETFDVHVGPSWFLTRNNFDIAKGDEIEVTGSKVKFGNTDALLARDIQKGAQKLELRDAMGYPLWSHGPRR